MRAPSLVLGLLTRQESDSPRFKGQQHSCLLTMGCDGPFDLRKHLASKKSFPRTGSIFNLQPHPFILISLIRTLGRASSVGSWAETEFQFQKATHGWLSTGSWPVLRIISDSLWNPLGHEEGNTLVDIRTHISDGACFQITFGRKNRWSLPISV